MKFVSMRKALPYCAVIVVALAALFWLGVVVPALEDDTDGQSASASPPPQGETKTPSRFRAGVDNGEPLIISSELAGAWTTAFLDGSDTSLNNREALAAVTALAKADAPDLDLILRFILAARQKGLLASRKALIDAIGVKMTEAVAFHGLASSDAQGQKWALMMFGTMKTLHAVPLIVDGLNGDWDASVRRAALVALSKINSDAAVATLREVVDDSANTLPLRRIGLYALGETYFKGRREVIDDLLGLLEPTREETLRQAAVLVIGKVRTPRVRATLSEVAVDDASANVRKSAIRQLAYNFKDSPEAYKTVRKAIHEDPAEIVRLSAIAAVARFENAEVIPELIRLASQNKSYAKTAGNTLARLDPGETLDRLEPLLANGSEKTRLNLIETLALLRSDRTRTILVRLRNSDASAKVRLSASKALAVLNGSP